MNENEKPSTEGENQTPNSSSAPEVVSDPTPEPNPTPEVTDAGATAVHAAVAATSEKKLSIKGYAVAIGAVAVILLGVLYLLEKEDRSSTNFFSSIIESQEANTVVAVVNGEEIINSELSTSIQQFGQAAAAQGVDLTDPDAQVEIRSQALDVLINTELLKQDAEKRGIVVTDEVVDERLESIKVEIGGEEVLTERMNELGIGTEKLFQDIKAELLISELLDLVFSEANLEVTEEEVNSVYENAGGTEAGLPSLEEVRGQVEAQIMSSKEQAAIDDYLAVLKDEADIEIQ